MPTATAFGWQSNCIGKANEVVASGVSQRTTGTHMAHHFVATDAFTPNNGDWTPIGDIVGHTSSGNEILLQMAVSGMAVQVRFLGPRAFCVRFQPVVGPDYGHELSYAVVNP